MALGEINSGNVIELTVEQINDIIKQTLLAAHPVGSIYQSLDSTSPETLFGGTWEVVNDVFLIGASSSYTAGSSGGSKTHLHTFDSTNKAYAMIGNYSNTVMFEDTSVNPTIVSLAKRTCYSWTHNSDASSTSSTVRPVSVRGQTDSNSVLPPYLAVYMWKRTA